MGFGIVICVLGMIFGLVEFLKIRKLPAHQSMLDISALIYETCKTYMIQQGKFLIVLEAFIGGCLFYYFYGLLLRKHDEDDLREVQVDEPHSL